MKVQEVAEWSRLKNVSGSKGRVTKGCTPACIMAAAGGMKKGAAAEGATPAGAEKPAKGMASALALWSCAALQGQEWGIN